MQVRSWLTQLGGIAAGLTICLAAGASTVPQPVAVLEGSTGTLPSLTLPELPFIEEEDLYLPELEVLFRLEIRLKDRRVYLFEGDELKGSYPIAVGKQGWETPTGDYTVLQKLKDPEWMHPWNGTVVPAGPNNPLGDRWIAFWTDGKNFIGFHGTPAEHLVGQAVSHGCIRMRNDDVRELFELVEVGTPVSVVP